MCASVLFFLTFSLLSRVAEFKAWLSRRKESTILVIAHGDFLATFSGALAPMQNAELIEYML